jgi:hypothetical protein
MVTSSRIRGRHGRLDAIRLAGYPLVGFSPDGQAKHRCSAARVERHGAAPLADKS